MKKTMAVFTTFLFLLLIVPFTTVFAESRTVTDQDTLKAALGDSEVDTILLGDDINTTEKINIIRPVKIDGNGHTIRYIGKFGDEQSTSNKVWGGIYVLQVYRTNATIKDIKLMGGNAALLVNGGSVKLEGTIDVSENGFGGIELGQGKGVEETVKLELDKDTNIVNRTEDKERPTLWVPDDSQAATLVMDGKTETISTGKELTLTQVEEMFGIQDSPETSVVNAWYSASYVLGLLGLGYSTKKMFG